MNVLRRNRILFGLLVATSLLLGSFAILRSGLIRLDRGIETPNYVDVIFTMGKSRRKLEIGDPNSIVVLQSLITGGRTVTGKPPARPEFEIFVPPPGKSTYSYSPSPVWRIAPDSFAWRHNGRTTELNGSFTDYVEWLEIRRINQLLASPDPAQRQLGEQLRDASREQHIAALLRIANSTNGWFAQAGIRELAEFISSEPSVPINFIPGEIQSTRRRAIVDPNRQVRDSLLSIMSKCPRPEHKKDPFGSGYMALLCLQQVGDRATADALAKVIERFQGGRLGDELLTTIERLYGIPATYERYGICGNSSAAELAQFAGQEAKRQAAAINDLLTWQQDRSTDTDEEFHDAVMLRWSEMLIHVARTPDRNGYHDRTLAPRLRNLLDLGDAVIPALQRRKVAATDWHEIAALEFCIALLMGECDAALVTELLDGDASRQRLACNIIAASADPRWNDRVALLLHSPLPSQNAEEIIALREVAAQAIYRSSGVNALPALRTALEEGFESQMILNILDRFEVPVTQF